MSGYAVVIIDDKSDDPIEIANPNAPLEYPRPNDEAVAVLKQDAAGAGADEEAENPKFRWHEWHNDPVMDIVLSSNDGVLLRGSSWVLKRESSVIQRMLDPALYPPMGDQEAISLHFSADTVALFLTCCQSADGSNLSTLPFQALYQYRKLVLYLGCQRLVEQVQPSYRRVCRKHPVKHLLAASSDNDVKEAKRALRRCGRVNIALDSAKFSDLLWCFRPAWRHALSVCLLHRGHDKWLTPKWPDKGRARQFGKDVERNQREAAEEGKEVVGISTFGA